MLSNHNRKESFRKQEPKKQRFAIKKFTVGVASVLIGFTFLGINVTANADAQSATTEPAVQTEKTTNNGSQAQSGAQQSGAQSAASSASSDTQKQASSAQLTSFAASNGSSAASSANSQAAQKSEQTKSATSIASNSAESQQANSAADQSKNALSSKESASVNSNEEAVNNYKSAVAKIQSQLESGKLSQSDAVQQIQTLTSKLTPLQQEMLASVVLPVETPTPVTDAQSLVNALKDGNVHSIQLQNDIDFSDYSERVGLINHNYATIDGADARALTINLGNHTLKMGDRYFYFKKGGQNWNITFEGDNKDSSVGQNSLTFTNNTYGPINFQGIVNSKNNTVTFDNVNMTGTQFGGAGSATSNTDLKFSGNNNVNSTNTGNHAAFLVDSVEVLSGKTTINDSNSAANVNRNAAIFIDSLSNSGNVVIDDGAELDINGQTKNTMGIFFDSFGDSHSTIDNTKHGLIKVGKNAKVTMNLQDGNSAAIYADDLDIAENGTVDITTGQNTTSTLPGNMSTNLAGIHNGVINLGMHAGEVNTLKNTELRIAKDGTLKVIRIGDKSTSALVSFGDILDNNGVKETVSINGGTLNLQDHAQIQNNWNFEPSKLISWAGLITMWGTSSTDTVDFENVKYVNLQRLGTPTSGSQTGSLLHLEGRTNNVDINTNTNGVVTPLALWDQGAAGSSFYWYIKNEHNQNNWGDHANGFTASGKAQPQNANGELKFMHSNGSVELAANQGGTNSSKFNNGVVADTPGEKINYQTPYLNNFLNQFSWWTPQRIAMGSDLEKNGVTVPDADKYAPEAQQITTTTRHKLGDEGVTVKDGIKDVLDSAGNASTDGYNTIVWKTDSSHPTASHWFDATKDGDAYKAQFGTDATLPTNPTGNLKTTDTSAVATIVYSDGSEDFVTVPLNVTTKTDAELNDPQGGQIIVAPNHTLNGTDAKNAVKNSSDLTDVADNGYTWTVKPSTDVPGSTNGGVVTVTYKDGSHDDVPVLVHVNSDADQNDPQGQDINVNKGETPNASDGIKNKSDLPSGTNYGWKDDKTPDTTTPGTKSGVVEVTYPDGSKDEVPVKVVVKDPTATTPTAKTDADQNDPQGQDVTTTLGNVPAASNAIANQGSLPTGTKYGWASQPDVWSKGSHPGIVEVTYPDNSVDYVPVNVEVTNAPTGQDITIKQNGTVPDPSAIIKWGDDGTEPTGTTITWATTPDVSQPGDTVGNIKVTYPDGHGTEIVPIVVHVTSTGETTSDFDPQGQSKQYGYGDDAGSASDLIVPSTINTSTDKVDWITKPDTKTPGEQIVHVKVTRTASDGTTTIKDVPVIVTVGTAADKYTPEGQNLTVNQGDPTPDAESAITNKSDLPTGTKYAWAVQPDTSTPGTQADLVQVTYPDGSIDYVPVNVKVVSSDKDNAKYAPAYQGLTVKQGETKTSAAPTFTDENGTTTNAPSRTTYGLASGAPSWASINSSTGKITVKPGTNVNLGSYAIPVTVTYPDNSTDSATLVVSVTGTTNDGNEHIYYGDQSMTSFSNIVANYHKTTGDYTPAASASQFNQIDVYTDWDHKGNATANYGHHVTYKLNAAGTEFVNTADSNDTFAADKITYNWIKGYTPNTNASSFNGDTGSTLYKNADGSFNTDEQTGAGDTFTWDNITFPTAGNSKWRYQCRITDSDVAAKLHADTNPNWCNVHFNFYGAKTGQPLTFKQNQDISNLTQEQYRQLIDVTDLGADGWNGTDVNPNAPQVLAYEPGTDTAKTFSMIWAPDGQPSTAAVKNGVKGTVRIVFNDGTYLDVPATINVVKDNDQGKPDSDKTEFTQKIVYTYNGKEVAYTTIDNIAKGSNLTAAQLKSAIDGNVPANYQIQAGYTYPAGVTNITATPAEIKVPLTVKADATFNATGKIVYQTVDGTHIADGEQIHTKVGDTLTAGLLHDLADQNVPTGYEITTYPVSFNVTKDGFVIPVLVKKQNDSPVPYKTGKKDVNDNMNRYVKRTIHYDVPAGQTAKPDYVETLHFTNEDASGNGGYTDPVTHVTTYNTAWHIAGKLSETTGTFADKDVDQITGYDSYIDGAKATNLAAKSGVASTDKDINVTVSYVHPSSIRTYQQG